MSKKLLCLILHMTTVLTAGGSATTQVVKSHGSHMPVETSAVECMGRGGGRVGGWGGALVAGVTLLLT